MMNTEDKQAWCSAAEVEEREFVGTRLPFFNLLGSINPAKDTDKYAYDLNIVFPSDLKSVRTPLFKAGELYGIDPQYAVTFNVKDQKRYTKLYPNIVVVFDVKWDTTCKVIGSNVYEVQPMHHTYSGFLRDIANAIKLSGCKQINYQRRVDDRAGNAKASWVFDVRHLHRMDVNETV